MKDNAVVTQQTIRQVGEFLIGETLGQGGMGEVYKAVHSRDGTVAAIKLLPLALAHSPALAKRFQREARAATAVRHKYLVEVQDFGQLPDGTLYLRMEYLPGLTLRQHVEAHGGRLSPRITLHLAQQLAEALGAIHAAGVVHRDLKPSNVMLSVGPANESQIKLLDFGIARFVDDTDDLTGIGQAFGTARYMAPEQGRGARELSPAIDLYALGVMLFELLTGVHPLQPQVGTHEELLRLHATVPPLPLIRLWPQAPTELATLLAQLLDKDPQHRPSATEVQACLTPLVEVVPEIAIPGPTSRGSVRVDKDATDPPRAPSLGEYLAERPCSNPAHDAPPPVSAKQSWRRWAHLGWGVLSLGAGFYLTDLATHHSMSHRARWGLGQGWSWLASWRHSSLGDKDFDRLPLPAVDGPAAPPSGMVYIAGGRFLQGGSKAQSQAAYDECVALEQRCDAEHFQRYHPQREVNLSPFFLDATEVTNEAFVKWLNQGVRSFDVGSGQVVLLRGVGIVTINNPQSGIRQRDARFEVLPDMAQRPVVLVSWVGAQTYCEEQGRTLPTEAQWEFVASRGGSALYPWGNRIPICADAVALGRDQYTQCPRGKPPEVRTMPLDVSPQGVYDLAGNVSEWMLDQFVHGYGSCGTCRDPQVIEPSTPSPLGRYRVVRGGSYFESRVVARATFRSRAAETKFFDNIGFRCARPLKQGP